MFTIRIDGIQELKAQAKAGHMQLVKDMQQGAAHAAQVATRQIQADAPVGKFYQGGGRLKKSIRPRLHNTANGATGDILIEAEHASFVKDGTAAHTIGPGKHMTFFWKGQWHFNVSSVHIPARAANDFVSPGVAVGQGILEHDAAVAVAKFQRLIEG